MHIYTTLTLYNVPYVFLTQRLSSSGFSSLVSAIGHARLFVYREVRAGSSAGYPVGHLVTSVPVENLTQNLRLQGLGLRLNPYGSLGYPRPE